MLRYVTLSKITSSVTLPSPSANDWIFVLFSRGWNYDKNCDRYFYIYIEEFYLFYGEVTKKNVWL